MADHYFTQSPESPHKLLRLQTEYRGQPFAFQTDSGVFSRTEIDKGTSALLAALPHGITGRVLDMGCGYGVLGICIRKCNPDCTVTMADINARAVALALANAKENGVEARALQSDGFIALANEQFELIVTNPPIRAGKQVIYRMFADAARALAQGGALMIVIRKQQGAPSAIKALEALFQTVNVPYKKSGYWVIRCEKTIKNSDEKRE